MVATATIISDTVRYIRNDLSSNITDPITGRSGRERFVMTSYPQRPVKYPIVTVKTSGIEAPMKLGMQSALHQSSLMLEVRIWARNVIEKDELSESILNRLRGQELTVASSESLHDFSVLSTVDVDEPGDGGIKSRVITIKYIFIYGA